jgi:predicted RecA/RadA family phage recombinase
MQARLLYGAGGAVHLTAAGAADTVIYNAGDVLAPALVDGKVCGVVSGSSPIRGGERFAAYTKGAYALVSASATTFAKAAAVEWNDSTNLAVAAAAGTFDVGGAIDAKVAGQTEVNVNLNQNVIA